MAELRIPFEYLDGRRGAVVEVDDDNMVGFTLDGETDDDDSTWRSLRPDEARALAAALRHTAKEVER